MTIPLQAGGTGASEVLGIFFVTLAVACFLAPLWWRVRGAASWRMVALEYLVALVVAPAAVTLARSEHDPEVRRGLLTLAACCAAGAGFLAALGPVLVLNQFAWFAGKGEEARRMTRGVVERARKARERGWLWHSVGPWWFFLGLPIVAVTIGAVTWWRHPVGWGRPWDAVLGAVLWLVAVGVPAGLLEALRVLAPEQWSREGLPWKSWPHPAAMGWMAIASMAPAFVLVGAAWENAAFYLYAAACVPALLLTRPQPPRGGGSGSRPGTFPAEPGARRPGAGGR